ncbi:MAG: CoA pyrophosphatase, partial [Bacteroidales bacterium]|nr:CoA pyrophosphatase [Bacteroidales bacterium]
AYEEVGIYPEDLKILGCLTPVSIPVSGYSVVPVVAYSTIKPNLIPEKEEVKTIITCNFQKLLASKTEQIINVRDITISVPCYMVKNYIVWGATAMVLSELEAILVSVMR